MMVEKEHPLDNSGGESTKNYVQESQEKPIPEAYQDFARGAIANIIPEDKPPIEELGIPFRNGSLLKFNDLSHEYYRVYCFPDGSVVRIDRPMKLNVAETGGHRVYTGDGISHYIPSGWRHLWWEVKEDAFHFSF